jgi:exonuclease SbcC
LTNWKYSSIELTDDYLMEIEGKSLELYSGWEKDLANLCLRLALSQNLTNNTWKNQINFMVLDEVLWSQDFERRNNILASLKWLEDKFSQIILISHVDEIKDIASSLVEVESINKYESKISLK